MALDFEKIRTEANAYAQNALDCTVALEVDDEEGVATCTMADEDDGEVLKVTVTDGGVHNGRQLMIVTDDEGEYLVEAFGQILAKVMWC